MRRLLALSYQFGICDHQDALSEGQKGGTHLVLSQGCTVYVWDTPIQTAATRRLSVGLFVWSCLVMQKHTYIKRSHGWFLQMAFHKCCRDGNYVSRINCCLMFHEIFNQHTLRIPEHSILHLTNVEWRFKILSLGELPFLHSLKDFFTG